MCCNRRCMCGCNQCWGGNNNNCGCGCGCGRSRECRACFNEGFREGFAAGSNCSMPTWGGVAGVSNTAAGGCGNVISGGCGCN